MTYSAKGSPGTKQSDDCEWFSKLINFGNDEFCAYETNSKSNSEKSKLPLSGIWLISQYNRYAAMLNSSDSIKKRVYYHSVVELSSHLAAEAYDRKISRNKTKIYSTSNDVLMFLEMIVDSISSSSVENMGKSLSEIEVGITFMRFFMRILEPNIFRDFDFREIEDKIGPTELLRTQYVWFQSEKNGFGDLSLETKMTIFGGLG